jgi:uncharacterized protein (DUF2164 family)
LAIVIDAQRKERLVAELRGFFQAEFDEELSRFRAEQVIDFMTKALGPQIYNQAVQDARKFMQERLDDLDGEVREIE